MMKPDKKIKFNNVVADLAFSPDGKTVAACFRTSEVQPLNQIIFLDPNTGEQIKTLDTGSVYVNCALFSPDGATLAAAGSVKTGFMAGEIKFWNTDNWQ